MSQRNYGQLPEIQNQAEKAPLTPRIENLIKVYKEKKLQYLPTYEDNQECVFFDNAKRDESLIQRYIPSLYRIKKRFNRFNKKEKEDTQEWLFWSELLTYPSMSGRPLQLTLDMGYYMEPITVEAKNNSGAVTNVKRTGYKYVPQEPFTKTKVEELLGKAQNTVTDFYVGYFSEHGDSFIDGQHYTILNVDDFLTGDFQELYEMSKFGYSTVEPSLELWRKEQSKVKEKKLQNK